MWKLKGLEKGTEPYLEVQEEYSLVLKVGRQDHSQGAWESIGLHEVEELRVWKGGFAPFLGCRRCKNHPGVQGRTLVAGGG